MLWEISVSLKDKYCVSTTVKLIETKSRMLFARGWKEEEMGNYCLLDMEFQFGKTEKVLQMSDGDGCTTMCHRTAHLKLLKW